MTTPHDASDLSDFVLPSGEVIRQRRVAPRSRKIRRRHFIKVPCAWVERLQAARYVVTYRLALHLLYESWRRSSRTLSLSNRALGREGVTLRGKKWRALRELEQFHLVTIERRPRRAPLVTICEDPPA